MAQKAETFGRDLLFSYKKGCNRIFFSRDPVAMDRIGLDILEEKRSEMGLESIRGIASHVEACGRKGVGISDPGRIDWRALRV